MIKTLLVCLFLGLSACGYRQNFDLKTAVSKETPWNERKAYLLANILNSPEWEKRWWIEKTVRLLRGGRPLRADEDIRNYEKLSKDEIISQLMSQKEFGDAVLDFNLFFLGFPTNILRRGSEGQTTLNNMIYNFPTAIASAQNVLKDQDFLQILDSENPGFIDPFYPPYPITPEDRTLTPEELLSKRILEFRFLRNWSLRKLGKDAENPENFCKSLNEVFRMSNSLPINSTLTQAVLYLDMDGLLGLQVECLAKNKTPSRERFLAYLENFRKYSEAAIKRFTPYFANYNPRTVSEIESIDLVKEGFLKRNLDFGFEQKQALPNSSTNSNRKRGAYILKQFFCDDLSPVGVEAPSEHTGGEHGSESSCYSCHYKLDPMAGLFKDRGLFMADFSKDEKIVFDDLALKNKDEYQERWKTKSGAWNIGYVRSVTQTSLNSYGENLEDLARITREAPEVKRCLVKRMFEYFISENQVVDGGYLNYLTQKFEEEAKINSSQALKSTVRRLLTSQSFANTDLDSEQCYDFAPGSNPGDGPPCKVAYILEKNCKICHGSTSAAGRLDLVHWIKNADGTMTFPHLDEQGVQRPTPQTFDEIQKRLTTTDPNLRMPYKKEMISQERQELYLWAQKVLSGFP